MKITYKMYEGNKLLGETENEYDATIFVEEMIDRGCPFKLITIGQI